MKIYNKCDKVINKKNKVLIQWNIVKKGADNMSFQGEKRNSIKRYLLEKSGIKITDYIKRRWIIFRISVTTDKNDNLKELLEQG